MSTHSTQAGQHIWRFFRAGGFDQVCLDSGEDFARLDQLDQKLWVALACPTAGIELDPKTAALLDTDKDGRIRAPEVIAAARWTCACLKNPDDLLKRPAVLALDAINDATPEGQQVLGAARKVLAFLKKDATTISLEDTTDTARIFAQTRFNGDGIVTPESADDAAVAAVIQDILACLGGETDRSGKPGVNQARVDQFFAEAAAFVAWRQKAETDPALLPAGEGTEAAAAAVRAVKTKVDDYFARCRLAAFDNRALAALNREEKEYLALAARDLTITASEIASFPLARIEPAKPLPLTDAVNPAWADALRALYTQAVKPLLGDKPSLTESDWAALQAKLAPFEAWNAAKAGAAVEKLGLKRLQEILAGKSREQIQALLAKDKAEEPNVNAIEAVDRLIRYQRDLYLLCTNFVNFKDFYDRGDAALFQAGTLYLDTRSCELCIRVEDMPKHATMAGLSRIYLAYCECTRKATNEKMTIVAAFTNGDSDNLMVGRNGIFYDRQGRDWDATITKIVDNPISIRQAFWSPYKKLARFIEETIAKRAAAADDAATKKLAQTVTRAETAAETGKAPEPPKPKMDTGLITALAIGAAGLGGMVGGIVSAFLGLGIFMPLGVIGVLLLISGPSMILAWLKLRQRNLGPLLDANGWAVNAKARINIPFGASLTQLAKLPPDAERNLTDPYAEKRSPWPRVILALLILAGAYYLLDRKGKIHQWTRGWIGKPAAAQTTGGSSTNAAPQGR